LALEGLVNRKGRLDKTYLSFDPSTVQCSHEITRDRETDASLRAISFVTADTALFRVEDGKVVLYFSEGNKSRRINPFLNNIDEATAQLSSNGFYRPTKKEIDLVIKGGSIRFEYSDLGLIHHPQGFLFPYFNIDLEFCDELCAAQRTLAEMVYGSGQDFYSAMNSLRYWHIASAEKANHSRGLGEPIKEPKKEVRINLLFPGYIRQNFEGDSGIMSFCRLSSFSNDADFSTFTLGPSKFCLI
jgi:hypothetical protein